MMLDQFETLAKNRTSCRSFTSKPVSEKLLERLIDVTRRAPSSYNLQPTHYILVRDQEIKKSLWTACLKQNQILEASCIVVFACDRKVVDHNAELVIQQELKDGGLTEQRAKQYRSFMKLGFDTSFFGFQGLVKRRLAPIVRWRSPFPSLPVENLDAWLSKQAALSCMTLLLASTSAGLSTCAMDAFDEKRLKKALSLDNSWYVPIIVALGYGSSTGVPTSRLPLSESVLWK